MKNYTATYKETRISVKATNKVSAKIIAHRELKGTGAKFYDITVTED